MGLLLNNILWMGQSASQNTMMQNLEVVSRGLIVPHVQVGRTSGFLQNNYSFIIKVLIIG